MAREQARGAAAKVTTGTFPTVFLTKLRTVPSAGWWQAIPPPTEVLGRGGHR
jgi:hypothetical protein